MELTGKVALITGGKRIGAVVAAALAKAGADVALVYNRSRAEADETAAAVRAAGRRAITVQGDVTSAGDCRRLVDATVAELGRLDILINMASLYASKPFEDLTEADWDRQLSVDLRASFLCSHAAAAHMKKSGGRIINFADWLVASSRPRYEGYLPYYVAKAGVKALTEALATELAGDQILVNAIAPGPILAPPEMSAEESAVGGEVDAARAVGRRGRDRESGVVPGRNRFRHRRNDPRRRRQASQDRRPGAAARAMATMWDSAIRKTFADRSARLTADTKPGWGKMNAAAMMAHLNDSYRMCLGDLPVRSKNLFSPLHADPPVDYLRACPFPRARRRHLS